MRNEELRRAREARPPIGMSLTFCERSEQSEKRERERRPQGESPEAAGTVFSPKRSRDGTGGASRLPPVAGKGRRASGRGRIFQASAASAEKGGHRNRGGAFFEKQKRRREQVQSATTWRAIRDSPPAGGPGAALTVHRTVIHYRPFESLWNTKKANRA